MLVCGNNALEQKTVHSSMTYYVHVLLYNAAKQMFTC
jgi:NADH:ubiquinone oxidoreductase subunit 3 (subunit A)